MGTRAQWARWVLVLLGLVVVLRLITGWALPLLPSHLAWGSSIVLAAALTMFFVPPPHEATLRLPPERDEPRP
jgi:hypothetical protein